MLSREKCTISLEFLPQINLLATVMLFAEIQSSWLIHLFLNQFTAKQAEIFPHIIRIRYAENQRYAAL